jgi:hypothetical protein
LKKWLLTQLTEPTAWICTAVIIAVLFFPDWFVILLAVVGILLDEAAMKSWCAKVAPGIAKRVEDLIKEI